MVHGRALWFTMDGGVKLERKPNGFWVILSPAAIHRRQ